MKFLAAILGLAFLAACSPDEPPGVYLIIELENTANVNQYTVFNTDIHSLAKCKATAGPAIPGILANAPPSVPRDSRVKSWRCSLIPPEQGG